MTHQGTGEGEEKRRITPLQHPSKSKYTHTHTHTHTHTNKLPTHRPLGLQPLTSQSLSFTHTHTHTHRCSVKCGAAYILLSNGSEVRPQPCVAGKQHPEHRAPTSPRDLAHYIPINRPLLSLVLCISLTTSLDTHTHTHTPPHSNTHSYPLVSTTQTNSDA